MVQKSFDVYGLTEKEWQSQYHNFGEHFHKMMKIKHGTRFCGVMAYQSDNIGQPGIIKVTLEAELVK